MTDNENVPLAGAPRLYELKISLVDAGVEIERRVLASDRYTLADLHLIIQAAMGWDNMHLHEFTSRDGTMYGDSTDDLDFVDEASALLGEVLPEPGEALRYVYDFGDSWVHSVELDAIRPDEGPAGPSCIGGRGACPPEDCGGVFGYRELCDVLADPDLPEYEELMEWLGFPFDPHAFNVDAANAAVRGLSRFARRSGSTGSSS